MMPWDKAEHFTAFFGLMLIAIAAFPKSKIWVLGLLLSIAGALVEVVQATPLIHRDADVWDWVADTLGILAVVGVVISAKVRRWALNARP